MYEIQEIETVIEYDFGWSSIKCRSCWRKKLSCIVVE